MMTPPSTSELLELVYRYYPRNLESHDPRYEESEESQRREARQAAARKQEEAWNAFLQRAREELSGCRLWELPFLLYHPCRCLRVALPDSPMGADLQKAVVLLVSVLVPVHVLYASWQILQGGRVSESRTYFPPLLEEFQPIEARLDALVQDVLHTARLSNDVLFTPVPDVQVGHVDLGQARLVDCLFSDDRW